MDDLQFDIFRLSQSCKSVVNLCFANLGTKSTKSNAIGTAIPIQVNDSFFKKNMDQTWPLFVYFRSVHDANTNLAQI